MPRRTSKAAQIWLLIDDAPRAAMNVSLASTLCKHATQLPQGMLTAMLCLSGAAAAHLINKVSSTTQAVVIIAISQRLGQIHAHELRAQ
jgi:hypothetical protein